MRSALLCVCLAAIGCSGAPASGDTGNEGSSSDGSTSTSTSDTGEETSSDESTDDGGPPGGSPGCGNTDAELGVFVTHVTIQGEEREITAVIPDGYDPDTAYAMVFAWHGLGSNPDQLRLYFGVEQAANHQAIFIYPLGLPVPSQNNQIGWNLSPNGEDVALFDALVAGFSDEYCVAKDHIFSTGHSFGGYMSNTLGCARSDVLRAIAPVAGGGPFGGCSPSPLAVWMTHGESDSRVPFSEGEGSRDYWLGINGCAADSAPVEPSPCVSYEGCADGAPMIWCPHQEGGSDGHGPPGFGADAIWQFFANG